MHTKKPDWLKVKIPLGATTKGVENMLETLSLNTVCKEANCPNRLECFHRRTATFLILGQVCTRNCTFCNITKGRPTTVDLLEADHVADAVKKLNLKHAVITSVTRDDLPDGGARHFVNVIETIRKTTPNVTVEVLIPDFEGNADALGLVVNAKPDIINHNVETVPNLYSNVRPLAQYERSLELLKNSKILDKSILTKSGFMLGLGENEDEVISLLEDLKSVDCDIITIGQYLAPSPLHHPVIDYVPPEVFDKYKEIGIKMGFKYVASAPLVRSSYYADKVFEL